MTRYLPTLLATGLLLSGTPLFASGGDKAAVPALPALPRAAAEETLTRATEAEAAARPARRSARELPRLNYHLTRTERELQEPQDPPPPPPTTRAQWPDLSFIADVPFVASNTSATPNRDEIRVREVEIALQGYLYPQIRGDIFFAFEDQDGEIETELEEAYLSFLQLGTTPFAARVGQMFLPFGRLNPIHSELWHHVDRPAVLRTFLGEEALTGRGLEVSYLLPFGAGRQSANGNGNGSASSAWFGQLTLGRHDAVGHGHGHDDDHNDHNDHNNHEHSIGIRSVGHDDIFREESPFDGRLYNARLWLSRAMSAGSELEFGASHVWGRTEEHSERDRLRVLGLDAVYRNQPSAFEVTRIQAEWLQFVRRGHDDHDNATRSGLYLLGWHRWDRFWSGGVRLDYVELPPPFHGTERSVNAFVTRHLSETTHVRLQLRQGHHGEIGGFTEGWLQFVFGMGPHAHRIE